MELSALAFQNIHVKISIIHSTSKMFASSKMNFVIENLPVPTSLEEFALSVVKQQS